MLHFDAQLINSIAVQTNPRPISIPAYTRGNSMDVVAVTFSAYMLVTSTTNITFSKTLWIWNGDKKSYRICIIRVVIIKNKLLRNFWCCVLVFGEKNLWLMLKNKCINILSQLSKQSLGEIHIRSHIRTTVLLKQTKKSDKF